MWYRPVFRETRVLVLAFATTVSALAADASGNEPKSQGAGLTIDEVAQAAAAIPVAAFFDHSAVSNVRVSPNGRKVAFLFPYEGKRALALYDRDTQEGRMILRGTNESFDACEWKGDEHLIVYADYHGSEEDDVLLTDLAGKKVVNLLERWRGKFDYHIPNFRGNFSILDSRPFDPERIAVRYGDGVYLLNVFNGSLKLCMHIADGLEENGMYHWLVDAEGKVQLYYRWNEGRVTLFRRDEATDGFKELTSWSFDGYDEANVIGPVQLSGDGKTAYVIVRTHHDRGALYAVDLSTGKWSEPLFVPPEGEISAVILSRDRNHLKGVSYEGARTHFHWFDAERGKLQSSIESAFPGVEVRAIDASADEQVWALRVFSDRAPGSYFLLDRKAGKIDLFKRELLKLDPQLMRPMEPFVFKARDGLELQGYLTRPWRAAKGPVPLVVHPHGGPFGIRDSWGFNPEVQFLASRGYAVVQVNYRGSGGYGAEFVRKGRYQWGRAMQDDLTDAVNWLVKAGVADPKRVAIFGASYGGYAALAGVTITPELYCCAVNYLGPADMAITFHRRGDDAFSPGDFYDYRDKWVGPNAEYRNATSPLRLIDRIRVPTLHAYGKNDPIIDEVHWKELKQKLTAAKKDFRFFIEKDQGHGFDAGEASIEFYTTLEAFFAQHLAPR